MMDVIAEQPIVVSVVIGGIGLMLIYAWLQSGVKALLVAGGLVLALIPVEWWMAGTIVTDREAIRRMIHDTAAAVEANDFDTALSVMPNGLEKAKAAAELSRFQFEEARMTGERAINVEHFAGAVTAEADINVRVRVTGRGIGTLNVPRRLVLDLEKRGDRWMVVGYRHLPPVGPADSQSSPVQ